MSNDERGDSKWADWKAKGGGELGGSEEEEPEMIFYPPTAPRLISDEEPTPPVPRAAIKNKPTQPAQEINLDQIQERLRFESSRVAGVKRDMEKERQNTKELDEIFEAVETENEGFIKGLIVREFGNVEFRNLNDIQMRLDSFFSGGRDLSVVMDFKKPVPQTKKMTFVFRPRVAGSAPFIEVVLVNETGLGKARNETITHVGSVSIVNPDGSLQAPPSPEKKTSWFAGLFAKKKN